MDKWHMAGFTDRFIEGLKAPKTGLRFAATDPACKGLAIRVTDKGTKTWAFTFKRNGRAQRVRLGEYPTLGLSDARALARKCHDDLHAGRSPADVRAAEKLATDNVLTFMALCGLYIQKYAKPNKRSWLEDERMLKRYIEIWGRRPAASLLRNEITRELDRRGATSPIASRRDFAVLHKMFRWAVQQGELAANPIMGAIKFGVEESEDRHLDDAEIEKFLRGLDTDGSPVSVPVARALRLVLLTAQRPSQISGLRRDELFDFDGPKPHAHFPKERMKGTKKKARPHKAPLGPWAIRIIKESLGEQATDNFSQYVFPARRDPESKSGKARGDVPITRAALSHALGAFCEHYGMKAFTTHDLRRTGRTIASKVKIPSDHAEALLAHRLPGMSKVYDIYDYLDEKRDAVLAIESYVRGGGHRR